MSGTYPVVMGDRGRLVVPVELRQRAGLEPGRPLVFVESDRGILLVTRDQLAALVRADLDGLDLVGDLLADRRREAAREDAA
ncbi:MAG: AbrB/MazE/SpoVT family DNA-binding domain-containing protein [Kineosporiaceae bacterium]